MADDRREAPGCSLSEEAHEGLGVVRALRRLLLRGHDLPGRRFGEFGTAFQDIIRGTVGSSVAKGNARALLPLFRASAASAMFSSSSDGTCAHIKQ